MRQDDEEPAHIREYWKAFAADLERRHLWQRLMPASEYRGVPFRMDAVVYFQCEGNELRYIGQTCDIERRRISHRKNGRRWDREWILAIPDDWPEEYGRSWMNGVEGSLIGFFSPPDNLRTSTGTSHCKGCVLDHLRRHGFKLPDGIGVGEPRWTLVRGPSFALRVAREAEAVAREAEQVAAEPVQWEAPTRQPKKPPRTLDEIIDAAMARRKRRPETTV
jgi:hypothetical protein